MKIFSRIRGKLYDISVVVFVIAFFCLSLGCTSLKGQNSALPKITVQLAVAKFIENSATVKRAARAEQVIRIAGELSDVNESQTSTLPFLKGAITERIAGLQLSPAEQLIVWNLVEVVQDELMIRIRAQIMSSDIRVPVRDVLQWVSEAASLYRDSPVLPAPAT